MKGFIFSLVLFTASLTATSQDSLCLSLSGIDIKVVLFGEDSSDVLMYNMHDNENTSALAGRVIAQKYGGEYFELIHNGKRNLSFLHGEDSIHIDPNRIYTDTGIWLQLQKNKIMDTLAHQMIASWRDSLLDILDIRSRKLVIALHNNTNQYYSFKSYLPGEEYEKEAQAVCKGTFRDIDDFYFVTDTSIMEKLTSGRYHVVLQANETMTDDGSLSVYCAKLGIPYINVECQHGHIIRQLQMLIFAFQQLVGKEQGAKSKEQ